MAFWDSAGDALGKLVDGYVKIETASTEARNPQLTGSVGVTEPVTQPVHTTDSQPTTVMTTTQTTPTNQIIAGVDNKYLALGVGGLVLLVMVMGGRR